MTANDIAQAEQALIQVDPVLGTLIQQQRLVPLGERGDYFTSLCRSIIGQQVSVAAATAIFGRFEIATQLQPAQVARLNDEELRAVGLSRQKISYIRDLAQHFVENPTIYNHLERQTDAAVITELTQVKGIGVWTAQIFLIFTLDRPDIFAADDLGLRNAVTKLYGPDAPLTKQALTTFAETWQPYRTIASLHLWQSLHNTP